MSLVLYEERGKIGVVTLNNPEKRNALAKKLLIELRERLLEIGREKKVRVVIIKGAGKVFSSGHDLREVMDDYPLNVLDVFQKCMEMMKAIREIPQPVIASVHGVATAAGCQLVAACDMAVAEEGTLFQTPGVKIGLFCSTPAVFVSRAINRKHAFEMLFTGDFVDAETAYKWGLINRVAPKGKLEEVTMELAEKIAQYSIVTLGIGKRMFYQQINMEDFQALNYATEVISLNSSSEDAKEGIRAFLEKREPVWKEI